MVRPILCGVSEAAGRLRPPPNDLGTAAAVIGRLTLFGVAHSLLAAGPVKRRLLGLSPSARRQGLYRIGYNAVGLATTGVLMFSVLRLPNRTIRELPAPIRRAMLVGQLVGGIGAAATAVVTGPGRFGGITAVLSMPMGDPDRGPSVAQHPPAKTTDRLEWGGPFRLCRHPNNFFPLLVFACQPTVTVKWTAFSVGIAIYMVVGSLREERRLETAYGMAFERYRGEIPHLLLPLGRRLAWPRRRTPST